MTFTIPTKYFWYAGLAAAAGLAYWYLKSSGVWDTWFNAQGNLIPAGPMPTAPAIAAQPPAQDASMGSGYTVPGMSTPGSGYTN